MIQTAFVALSALWLGNAAARGDADLWRMICTCKVKDCTTAADVIDAAKILPMCQTDMPGAAVVASPIVGQCVNPEKCKDYDGKRCCPGFTCVLNFGRKLLDGKVYGSCVEVCIGEGEKCTSKEKCCAGLECASVGGKNKCVKPCSQEGGLCDSKTVCCGGNVCRSGICTRPCIEQGQGPCILGINIDCCGDLVCTKKYYDNQKKYVCELPCVEVGQKCEKLEDCCKGSCVDDGKKGKKCTLCAYQDEDCSINTCCAPLACAKMTMCEIIPTEDCKNCKKEPQFKEKCVDKFTCVYPCKKVEEQCEKDSECCGGLQCFSKQEVAYKKCKAI